MHQGIEEAGVAQVGEVVFAELRGFTGIEVDFGQVGGLLELACGGLGRSGGFHAGEVEVEAVYGAVDALEVDVLLVGVGDLETEDLEGADLGQDSDEEGQDAGADAGVGILFPILLLELGALEAVDELLVVESGVFLLDLVFIAHQGYGRDLGDEAADGAAVAGDGEVFVFHDGVDADTVGLLEGAFEEILGDLEADEVAVVLLGVATVGDLDDVEAELGAEVGDFVLVVGDGAAEAAAELGILVGGDLIDGGMAYDVSAVVGEGSEGEGVLVGVVGLADEVGDEVAGADVVEDIGEFMAAEGVVADVLDDRAAVGVGVSGANFIVREGGEAGAEERDDVRQPSHIDDLFVGEDGVGSSGRRKEEQQEEKDSGRAANVAGEDFHERAAYLFCLSCCSGGDVNLSLEGAV